MVEFAEEDTFKILLATDNHLGYGRNKPNIENDTFVTFEEILNIAAKENVDFILLGGDLFHETRPTTYCYTKCVELIRKYCFGDKCVEIEVLSDPSVHFYRNPIVNYEDPNMNISIPIFSIHGNHDDPTGKEQTSAMDLLASVGLINYFGRCDDVTEVNVDPILLKKGESQLALYGLSHIRDERLGRLFLQKKVKFRTPEKREDWFNMLVLHQNRVSRGVKNYIPETSIPTFMNLVMWGHEHDCQIEATPFLTGNTYITQPGSSVATSLSEGEAIEKKVGLLRIKGRSFNITPIPLLTVRPFIYKNVTLPPPPLILGKLSPADRAKQEIKHEVGRMIQEAQELGRVNNMLPLLRLVVKYEHEGQVFNAIRFGQEFADRVANPEDIIKFSSSTKRKRTKVTVDGLEVEDEDIDDEVAARVEDLIPKYLEERNKLDVLCVTGLNEAVRKCIDSNDGDAPSFILNNQEEFLLKKLLELQPDEADVEECLKGLQTTRNVDDFRQLLNDPRRPKATIVIGDDEDDVVTIEDDDQSASTSTPTKPARGRGSRSGRGSRGPRGGRGRAK